MMELANVTRLMMRSSFHFFMPCPRCLPLPILIGCESVFQVTEGSDQGVGVTCDYPIGFGTPQKNALEWAVA